MSSFNRNVFAASVASLFTVAQANEVGGSARTLESVVVSATRTPQDSDKVPASVDVLTLDDFESVQAGRVSDAMKRLPNVEFGGGPRLNGEVPSIRGVSGPSITLLIDGARQNDTTSPSLKSPLFVDPYFLRQAEVVRGSASSLYGSGGIGGVMSFTTLSARDLLDAGQAFGGGARAGYASADKSMRVNARVYGANDRVDALVALGAHDWNRIRQGGGTYLDPNDGQAATGLLKAGVRPVRDGRIELSHQFYRSENLQVNNGQATDFRVTNLPIDKPAVQSVHVDQRNTVLKGSLGKTDGAPALVATLYRTSLQYASDPSPYPAITNVLYGNTRTVTDGASVQGSHVFESASFGRHRVTAGLDRFKDTQTAISATAANPSAPSTVTRNGQRDATGLFLQDEIQLGDKWTVTPSLRGDRYGASLADGSQVDNSASRRSPKLSVAWQDGRGWMLFSSVGEAFRAPTVVELYQNFVGFGLTNFLPNATLRAEVERSLEFGTNLSRTSVLTEGDRLRLRATWFDARVTDLIFSANLGGMTPTGASAAQLATFAANCRNTGLNCKLQYQNVPEARRTGGEAQVGYDLDPWQFNVAYSQVRVENRVDGSGLYSPPDKLGLQVGRRFARQGLTVAWATIAVASQDYDATLSRRRPGYVVHDLFASWAPSGRTWRVDLGVTNLTDKRYAAYQSSNAYAYTYQEGRSVKVALSASL